LLYCELADELKHFEPSMNKVKRQILAEHVMEAVEGLELRAKRINVLQAMVGGEEEGGEEEGEYFVSRERRRKKKNNRLPVADGGDLGRRVVSA
jgi:hypothetical protein